MLVKKMISTFQNKTVQKNLFMTKLVDKFGYKPMFNSIQVRILKYKLPQSFTLSKELMLPMIPIIHNFQHVKYSNLFKVGCMEQDSHADIIIVWNNCIITKSVIRTV